MRYSLTNITHRVKQFQRQSRRNLLVDGSVVRPEETRQFDVPTQDICQHLDDGAIVVTRGSHPIRRTGDFVLFDIERVTTPVSEETVDGTRIIKRVRYEIRAADEEVAEELTQKADSAPEDPEDGERQGETEEPAEEPVEAPEETSEEEVPEEGHLEEEVSEDEAPEDEAPEEEASEEDETAGEEDEEANEVLRQLDEAGIERSSDLNLSQLYPLLDEAGVQPDGALPLSFFEGETRKGAQEALADMGVDLDA
jgi:hypothetical protein